MIIRSSALLPVQRTFVFNHSGNDLSSVYEGSLVIGGFLGFDLGCELRIRVDSMKVIEGFYWVKKALNYKTSPLGCLQIKRLGSSQ